MPLPQRNIVQIHALVVALAEAAAQQLPVGIHQQNAERVEGDKRVDGPSNLTQQIVQVQDGAEFLRQIRQRLEGAVLAVDPPVQPRIVDGNRNAGCDQL